MTDLLTTDHADSGEVVRLHPSIVDTHRLDLGEHTGNLAPYAHGLRPRFRRPDSTGEQPVYRPQTISVVDLQEPPIAPPPVPLPPPVPTRDARPSSYRSRHRKPVPVWAWALGAVALSLSGGAVGGGAVLALAVLKAGGAW